MITVGELLATRFFKNFRFATKKVGLNTTISASGFFEWESKLDIKRTFRKGEFVVTTLSLAKDDKEYAEECLIALIANGASAIAIKDIHFKDISDKLRGFAEKNNVPILFFTDTYVDDVLFNVRTLLLEESNNPIKKEKILRLIRDESNTQSNKREIIYSINPHFFDENILCSYVTKKNNKAFYTDAWINDFVHEDFNGKHSNAFVPSNTVYMFIPFMNGLLLIYTGNENASINVDDVMAFLADYLSLDDDYYLGISRAFDDITDMDQAIKESIYANAIGNINNDSNTIFDITSDEHILCPLCYNSWMIQYHDGFSKKLEAGGSSNQNQLLETLRVYVESEGDINLTSKLLFQHNNTTRYRLAKIKTLLDIESDAILFSQAHTFIYLDKIKKLLDPIFCVEI